MDGQSVKSLKMGNGSDEEDEVHYIKPVVSDSNTMDNIVELFAELPTSSQRANIVSSNDKQNPRHSVTFAENLEKYASDSKSACTSSSSHLALAHENLKCMEFGEPNEELTNEEREEAARDEEIASAYNLNLRRGIDVAAGGDPGALRAFYKQYAVNADGYILPTTEKFASMPKEMDCDVFDAEELEVLKDGDGYIFDFDDEEDTISLINLLDSDGEEVNNKGPRSPRR